MRRFPLPAVLITLVACGGAVVSGARFQFAPDAGPLSYSLQEESEVSVSAPGMNITNASMSDATLRVEIGDQSAAGWSMTATYEDFSHSTSGDMGSSSHNGDGFTGKPFTGVVTAAGGFDLQSGPDIPSALLEQMDPAAFLFGLFPALPPAGADQQASWPHRFSFTDRTMFGTTTEYDGVATFAGDTVWGGVPARIIVSSGTVSMSGTGTPPGAPMEMTMTLTGNGETRYIWDPVRGVMLAAITEGTVSGNMRGGGFEMPVSADTKITVRLER